MRVACSYARLFIASWLFLGGIAMQLNPSPEAVARDARWRDHKLEQIPTNQRAQWIEDRDIQDAGTRAYLRLFGVLMGGTGFAMALRETAYLNARYSR
ncbi:MAG TPA: hypothetical protein VNX28_13195 [Gemmataceae bacterium]|jgi:hypothetical protein|nr:hypothetical protein [Gemmataceae bacterium]